MTALFHPIIAASERTDKNFESEEELEFKILLSILNNYELDSRM